MEIEMKIPLEPFFSPDNILPHLSEKLGTPYAKITQIDTFFQSPIKDFRQSDEALRIRQIQSKEVTEIVEFTYKGSKEGKTMKIRDEISVEVSDKEKLLRILQKIGFQDVAIVKKERINWKRFDAIVSYDKVDDLGFYLEIELLSTGKPKRTTGSKEKINRIAKEIIPKWTGMEERRSYLELLILKQANE
jgi:adenylate cyclase class 2